MSFKRMMIKKNIQISEIAMNQLMKEEEVEEAKNENNAGKAGGGELDPEEEQLRLVLEMSKS